MQARWDIFCRVIDNYGDIGVCWRLATDMSSRGHAVRLWVDDPSALTWMATAASRATVDAVHWTPDAPDLAPGDAVVEAFGCDPPEAFVARMAAMSTPPAWINLEYLSAEDYVERSHGLPSPVLSGPGAGLVKRFFYPGFTPRTGGLLREPELMAQRTRFDRDAWLRGRGWTRQAGERVVLLFCYAGAPALDGLLHALSGAPTLLLATPGEAAGAVARGLPGGLRGQPMPFLPQPEFDHALWASDLNLVRGEDSFVRAQWAGVPFVWQIYPQRDGAHQAKLRAFLDRFLAAPGVPPGAWQDDLRALWAAWNGLAPWPGRLPADAPWRQACLAWREALLAQPDLTTQLLRFVALPG